MPIDSATLRYLLPEMVLVLFAVLAFIGGTWNRTKLGWSTLAIMALGLAALLLGQHGTVSSLANSGWGVVIQDPLSGGLRSASLVLGGLLVVFSTQCPQQRLYPELLGLMVLVIVGLMLVCSAGDLVLLFVGLELISIPTYVLLFIGRDRRDSDEAAAKYFFLSILSSAMMLYGFANLYGLAGDTNLTAIASSLRSDAAPLFPGMYPLAVGLILVGLCFKIAAVPFHYYAPDVYQASTNLNAALLAVVPKIAGVVALVRILIVAVPHDSNFVWRLILVLSVLTMTLGNVSALWQTNVRRIMAYSSIAHAGYLLIGLAAAAGAGEAVGEGTGAVAAMLFYVVAYAAATIGVFAAMGYLSDDDETYSTLDGLAGVGRVHPVIGAAMAICLFSLAGIPPLAGFWGKFALFRSALDAGLSGQSTPNGWYLALCVVGVLNAAIAAGYYLRLIAALYFQSAAEGTSEAPVMGNAGAGIATLMATFLVVIVGFRTGPAMTRAQQAAEGLQVVEPQSTPIARRLTADDLRGIKHFVSSPSP